MITFLLCSLIVVSRLQPGLCLHIIPGRLGSDFNYAYGVYTDGDSLDDQLLTGELLDGTAINNEVYIYSSGTVTLQAIPEPSPFAVFGSGTCGLVLVRRRRTATQSSAA